MYLRFVFFRGQSALQTVPELYINKHVNLFLLLSMSLICHFSSIILLMIVTLFDVKITATKCFLCNCIAICLSIRACMSFAIMFFAINVLRLMLKKLLKKKQNHIWSKIKSLVNWCRGYKQLSQIRCKIFLAPPKSSNSYAPAVGLLQCCSWKWRICETNWEFLLWETAVCICRVWWIWRKHEVKLCSPGEPELLNRFPVTLCKLHCGFPPSSL